MEEVTIFGKKYSVIKKRAKRTGSSFRKGMFTLTIIEENAFLYLRNFWLINYIRSSYRFMVKWIRMEKLKY